MIVDNEDNFQVGNEVRDQIKSQIRAKAGPLYDYLKIVYTEEGQAIPDVYDLSSEEIEDMLAYASEVEQIKKDNQEKKDLEAKLQAKRGQRENDVEDIERGERVRQRIRDKILVGDNDRIGQNNNLEGPASESNQKGKLYGAPNKGPAGTQARLSDPEISSQIAQQKFKDTINQIADLYNGSNLYRPSAQGKGVTIGPNDFALLSKFEKNTLRSIANIYGMLSDPTKDVSYEDLVNIINKLRETKSDIEKHYLLSLFFPEKVKNIHTIYPFPIPTYSYSQKFQVFVSPNVNGCFLAQVVCPLLLDNSVGNATVSNLYVNTNSALDGSTLGTAGQFTPIVNTQSIQGAFNTYVLQCCKLSARYVGRSDVMSGYFGASYNLSTTSSRAADPSPTQFNYVDDSINAVVADVTEGLNTVYYPPDYSYLSFLKVNNDNITGGQMSTAHRMNIYGASLPPPSLAGQSAGVILTFVCVWNIIPTPAFADLLPLDYNLQEQSMDLLEISKFVPQSGLTSYKNADVGKIERMMSLPKNMREKALEEFIHGKSDRNLKNILDVLDPIVGDGVPRPIYIDKSFLNEFNEKGFSSTNPEQVVSASAERKKKVDGMNLALYNLNRS